MVVYIKKSVPKKFVVLEQELDKELYSNIGITFTDYELGFWVKLSDSQKDFYLKNPTANVEEVWNTQLHEELVTELDKLEQSKKDAIHTICLYDLSNAVNGFILNDSIKTWFTVEQRLNYKQSIEAAKLLGEETLEFLVEGKLFTVSVNDAEYMLAQIQRYADKCYLVTETHKANINSLNTIEDIDNYDYMIGYPEMLKFELV